VTFRQDSSNTVMHRPWCTHLGMLFCLHARTCVVSFVRVSRTWAAADVQMANSWHARPEMAAAKRTFMHARDTSDVTRTFLCNHLLFLISHS
jgi:hypothetical protein